MASKPVKHQSDDEWSLAFGKRKCTIDYNKCVICQEHAGKLFKIQKESWDKLKVAVKPGKTRLACFCWKTSIMIPGLMKRSHYGIPGVETGISLRRATLWLRRRDLEVCLITHRLQSMGQVCHVVQDHPLILTNQNQTASFVIKVGTKAKSLQVKLPQKTARQILNTLPKD